ncbi:hypothetical protein ACHAQH_009118 [Verticillium albo-atrum]
MPVLALAGGTSPSLGRAIITALFAQTPWHVLILSRTTKPPVWLRAIDPEARRYKIAAVDYASVESVTSALKAGSAHTLISVTSAVDGTQAETQIKLLHAAVAAGCLRFAPSAWGFGPKGWQNVPSLQWTNAGVKEACAEQRGKIEIGHFNHGSFLNYVGHGIFPTPQAAVEIEEEALALYKKGNGYLSGEDDAVQGLHRMGPLADGSGAFLVGLKNGIAELPVKEDGTWPQISWTSARDVGRFVAASLDLPKWEEEMTMAGETITMGELLASAESVAGKKIAVTKLEKKDLEERLEKSEDFMERLWLEFYLAYIRDEEGEVVLPPTLNRLCPQVKPSTVRQYMEEHWSKAW